MWPATGVAVAIAVTSTMDATGATVFSALPLFPLLAIFWYLQHFSASDLGFSWGRSRVAQCYAIAVFYPVAVTAVITGIAAVTGALNPAAAPHHKTGAWLSLLILGGATVPLALITEEGFFRGWLWASLRSSGAGIAGALLLSSVAFALWHWSAVILPSGFNPPLAQVPVFMLNAAVMGAIWAILRQASGSLVVSSVSHGVWNALAYVLFGFGSNIGALGISNTAIYGPEVGVLGLVLNLAVATLLWRWYLL